MQDQRNHHSGSQEAPHLREPVFNIARTALAFILVNFAVHAVSTWLLTEDQNWQFLIRTAFIPWRYSGGFPLDVWAFISPVSYSFLHASWTHLAVNMVWLAAFGSPLTARIGVMRFVVFWIVTALAAAGLHFLTDIQSQAPLVGASGAVSGMMGAAARFGFVTETNGRLRRFRGKPFSVAQTLASRRIMPFLGIWLIVNFATGMFGEQFTGGGAIAWQAHVGGFACGFFLIPLFCRDDDQNGGAANRTIVR